MIYLTYNDAPSGIYSGQVTDVCRFLNKNLNAKARIVSVISMRGFWMNRAKIKSEFPEAIVLPMFPKVNNWAMNFYSLFFLFLFLGKQRVIARGPFAALLALRLKRTGRASSVCFDARGAYDAEFNEYNVAGSVELNSKLFSIEKDSLLNSDFRIAVSCQLVTYWKEKFGYDKIDHVVIPCTVDSGLTSLKLNSDERSKFGFSSDDVVFVYSGSSAGWQSLALADDFLLIRMKLDPKAKALLLVDKVPESMKVQKEYPNRVAVRWLSKNRMVDALHCCDYGLLLREKSVTNQVSSPVKFAEYLSAGLQVVISEDIGDCSEFVRKHACGIVVNGLDDGNLFPSVSAERKQKSMQLAADHFSKAKYLPEYSSLIKHLS